MPGQIFGVLTDYSRTTNHNLWHNRLERVQRWGWYDGTFYSICLLFQGFLCKQNCIENMQWALWFTNNEKMQIYSVLSSTTLNTLLGFKVFIRDFVPLRLFLNPFRSTYLRTKIKLWSSLTFQYLDFLCQSTIRTIVYLGKVYAELEFQLLMNWTVNS